VNAEFNWWLLIVGLVIGAGLVWLVVADSRRREVDVTEREREGEARWIAETLRDAGRRVHEDDVLDVLNLHAAYLAAAPPDELDDDGALASERDLVAPDGRDLDRRYSGPDGRPASDARTTADDRRWVPVPETPAASSAAPDAPLNRR
jgi:hypothetical protein